jgi:hypothetical protein
MMIRVRVRAIKVRVGLRAIKVRMGVRVGSEVGVRVRG